MKRTTDAKCGAGCLVEVRSQGDGKASERCLSFRNMYRIVEIDTKLSMMKSTRFYNGAMPFVRSEPINLGSSKFIVHFVSPLVAISVAL